MEFETGRRVRCIARSWRIPRRWGIFASQYANGPKFGAVVTVAGVYACDGALYLELAEFPPQPPTQPLFNGRGCQPLEDAELERLRAAIVNPTLRASEIAGLLPR